jgi:hypothetical protein
MSTSSTFTSTEETKTNAISSSVSLSTSSPAPPPEILLPCQYLQQRHAERVNWATISDRKTRDVGRALAALMFKELQSKIVSRFQNSYVELPTKAYPLTLKTQWHNRSFPAQMFAETGVEPWNTWGLQRLNDIKEQNDVQWEPEFFDAHLLALALATTKSLQHLTKEYVKLNDIRALDHTPQMIIDVQYSQGTFLPLEYCHTLCQVWVEGIKPVVSEASKAVAAHSWFS